MGPALAMLLDRVAPAWPARLEQDDTQPLDVLLTAAVGTEVPPSCRFTDAETDTMAAAARHDVAAMATRREERRRSFDEQPGWRLVLESPAAPLWPQGFDPLNLDHVKNGLPHTRFLKLGNDAGRLQAVDGPGVDVTALTEAAGPHPLFNGVKRAVVGGLAPLVVTNENDGVTVRAPGLDLHFRHASATQDAVGRVVTVRLER